MGLENLLFIGDEDLEKLLVSLICSLIGSLIGHFKLNGVISLPVVYFFYECNLKYENGEWKKNLIKLPLIIIDFLLFLIGLRFKNNLRQGAITLELGFLGDMLVGVGTGIIAYSAVMASGTTSMPALMTSSLLAGYGGFTYLQKMQGKSEREQNKNDVIEFKEIEETDFSEPEEQKTAVIKELRESKQVSSSRETPS
ncbi:MULTISPECIES: hypothetical protein [Bacillus]|uniref:hypothetical protein n=1 Tax=Bacillus TaxID=1386 RepID=UPI00214C661F|nr:hypothetical protein [Bacillus pumilus]